MNFHYTTKILILLFITTLITSCSVFKSANRNILSDGVYTKKTKKDDKSKVYLQTEDEVLKIYQVNEFQTVDITNFEVVEFRKPLSSPFEKFTLIEHSIDVDALTIPFKYRFSIKDVQPQLNTNLTGAVFMGYRTDRYQISEYENALNIRKNKIKHFGYSFGLFSGLGNTFMSPTTTNDGIDQEYDGLVVSNGLAAILAVNNISLGLTLGVDHLLDSNANTWIYQGKPWVGFALGLNLN